MNTQSDSTDPGSPHELSAPVSQKESGQKLLRFLERRLGLPEALLHRWIRTGQIRINGRRCKAFERVSQGDIVRLPPFALTMAEDIAGPMPAGQKGQNSQTRGNDLKILENWRNILVIEKPAGLPVHAGTGHDDCVSARLARMAADDFFRPAPAHRLDRDTSGLLLAGATYESLATLQRLFASGMIHKEYLAWVEGHYNYQPLLFLRQYLRKEKTGDNAKMQVYEQPVPHARPALALFEKIATSGNRSLLRIRILTGVTHQIRAQLASIGFPIVGDGKYGKKAADCGLCLHASRIVLPEGREFVSKPLWTGELAVGSLPEPVLSGCLPGPEAFASLPDKVEIEEADLLALAGKNK